MRSFVLPIVCLATLLGCGPQQPADQPTSGSSGSSGSSDAAGTPTSSAAPTSSSTSKPPETVPISGTLSNAQIQAAVNANLKAFDACYTLGADKEGKLDGTVTIRATVGPHGDVNVSEVMKSTVKNEKVGPCVAEAFKKVKFPKPDGGSTAVITYPMTFGGEVVYKK